MARPRNSGILDPLFADIPSGEVRDLARELGVARQTLHRWQKRPETVGEFHRMRINLMFIGRGLAPPFPVTSTGALKEAIKS